MKKQIETTGSLRESLAQTIRDVYTGNIDNDRASRITKLAGQINESFYAEIKVARVRAEAGHAMGELGSMKIGDPDAAKGPPQ